MPLRLRHGAARPSCAPRPRRPRHRRHGPGRGRDVTERHVHPATGTRRGDGGLRIVAYDFGVKTTMVRQLADAGHRHRGARRRRRPTRCWRSSPTASSSPTGRATPPRSPGPTAAVADLVGRRARSSASASATRSWPRRWAATTYKLPFGHHGANHPCSASRPGVVEITEPEPQLRRGRRLASPTPRSTHVNLNDGVIEGFRSLDGAGVLGAVPPRGRPRARTTPATSSARSATSCWPIPPARPAPALDGDALMPRRDDLAVDPRHRLGPDRDRPGLRVRLLGHPGLPGPARGGLPGDPGQLQPGHDHDGPRHGRPRPTSSRSTPRCSTAIIEKERPDALLPDARRPDGAQPDHGAGRARRARALRRRGDRRAARGHRDRRGPRPLQGGHGGDRPRGAPLGLRPLAGGGRGDRGRDRVPDHGATELHPRGQGDRHRRGRGALRPAGRRRAWPPARSARSSSSSRSPAGRSSSSR